MSPVIHFGLLIMCSGETEGLYDFKLKMGSFHCVLSHICFYIFTTIQSHIYNQILHINVVCFCGSVLVGCSSITNKAHWKSMLERNELNLPEEVKKSHELNIEVNWYVMLYNKKRYKVTNVHTFLSLHPQKSDMNVIMCWVCKKSIHEIKSIVLHEIKQVN